MPQLSPSPSYVERPVLDVLRQLSLPVVEHRHRADHQSAQSGVDVDGGQAGGVVCQSIDQIALVALGVEALGLQFLYT